MHNLETKTKQELFEIIENLIEMNRLKTIALQQSVNRTSSHVHEKIIKLESWLNEQ